MGRVRLPRPSGLSRLPGLPRLSGPRRPNLRRLWKVAALGAAVVTVVSAVAAYALYRKFDGNIRTDESVARALALHSAERPRAAHGEARNILLMGSDYTAEHGNGRSDTTMLLHLSGDRKRAEIISVPRDLYADIPSCATPGGGRSRAQRAQFNWAYEFGGAACTIRTFERLTGIRVDHHLVLQFAGFKKIVNAVGGVEVNLPKPERDPNVGLDLPAGRQTIKGDDALAYVRARQYVGDGSDPNRIRRQQAFLTTLGEKLRGSGVLASPTRIYPVLDAATSSVTADSGLDSLAELYGMVKRVRAVPQEDIAFLTVPYRTAPDDADRLVLQQPAASRLLAAVRADRPAPKV
ncbi:LCP family protein [Streptomyces sp. NPDC059009]|uniref:LCP family protein n=1 Tax=Streptomyces sp. NPDC059009 TaxID=3346694 RepID=UPI0036BF952A